MLRNCFTVTLSSSIAHMLNSDPFKSFGGKKAEVIGATWGDITQTVEQDVGNFWLKNYSAPLRRFYQDHHHHQHCQQNLSLFEQPAFTHTAVATLQEGRLK